VEAKYAYIPILLDLRRATPTTTHPKWTGSVGVSSYKMAMQHFDRQVLTICGWSAL